MENLSFETGYKEYSINGDETKVIRIDTTDIALYDRAKKAIKNIEELAEEYQKTEVSDPNKTNDLFVKADKDIRLQIDQIFGYEVSSIVFGITNCMSVTRNGCMLFENFLNAVVPEIKKDMEKAMEKQNKQVEKYTSQVVNVSK